MGNVSTGPVLGKGLNDSFHAETVEGGTPGGGGTGRGRRCPWRWGSRERKEVSLEAGARERKEVPLEAGGEGDGGVDPGSGRGGSVSPEPETQRHDCRGTTDGTTASFRRDEWDDSGPRRAKSVQGTEEDRGRRPTRQDTPGARNKPRAAQYRGS